MKWDEVADDALRTLFDNEYSDEEIADYFGFEDVRTVSRRRQKLRLLRVQHQSDHRSWTDADIKLVHETLHLTCDEVARLLQHSEKTAEAVRSMRKRLKLRSTRVNRWTPQRLHVLYTQYAERGGRYVAQRTGLSPKSVHAKASAENIRRHF